MLVIYNAGLTVVAAMQRRKLSHLEDTLHRLYFHGLFGSSAEHKTKKSITSLYKQASQDEGYAHEEQQ